MEGYLGDFHIEQKDTPYKDYTPSDWALLYILKYGGIDGAHHKTWVLDQVVRILNHAPVKIAQARWKNGFTEYRFEVGSSKQYEEWVRDSKKGEDGPETYDYDEGIPP